MPCERVRVAIVDTGIEPGHREVGPVAGGVHIALDGSDAPVFDQDWADRNGHGTACAGIVHRVAPSAELYSVRISDEDALSSAMLLVHAIRWSLANGMHIVNLSLGTRGERHRDELREVCTLARSRSTVLVAAESNENERVYPAALEDVVAVAGATTQSLFQVFKDPHNERRFFGQGRRQPVAWMNGERRFLGGNSMAAGQVSGLLALLREKHPEADVDALVGELRGHAACLPGTADSDARERHLDVLAAPIPRMKRALLYPFSKEMHSLVRFRDQLPFEILAVVDPLGRKSTGLDAGDVLGIGSTGIPVITRNDEIFGRADGLVLGHMSRLQAVRRRNYAMDWLQSALEHRLHVFSFDALDSFGALLGRAKDEGLEWTWPRIAFDAGMGPALLAHVNDPIDVPVLGVFGTRSGQGKFTTQLALCRSLRESGYSVAHLSTEPQGPLFGADAVFPMGFGSQVPFDLGTLIPFVRHQVSAICKHRRPEILVVGSQSGTIPRDPHLRHEFLCLGSQHFLYATRPDAVFLTVQPDGDAEETAYTRDTIEALRVLGKTRVIGLSFSNKATEDSSDEHGRKRRRMRFLEPADCSSISRRLEATFGLPAFSPAIEEHVRSMRDAAIAFFGAS